MKCSLVSLLAICIIGISSSAISAQEAAQPEVKPIKALLILGGCCHDYAKQKDILAKGISERANVEITIAYDPDKTTHHLNPIYKNPDWYKGYDVVIHDECSSEVKDLDVIEGTILKPHKDGLPAVVLHCAMHCYRSAPYPKTTPWMQFTGLNTNHHNEQLPISIKFTDKTSPITKGLEDWTTIHEELYHEESLMPTATPLANGTQRKNGTNVVVWTNMYNGKTRVFGTTIGHNNQTCADARYLDLVTRGLLWSVHKLDENGKPKPGYGPRSGGPTKSASAR